MAGWTLLAVALIYALMSAWSFALYGLDKRRAVKSRQGAGGAGKRRVSERTLHLVDLAGGWPGGLLARRVFHHKSNAQTKRRFVWMNRLIVAVHLALWALVAYFVLR